MTGPWLPRRWLWGALAALGFNGIMGAGPGGAQSTGASRASGALGHMMTAGEVRIGVVPGTPPWSDYDEFGRPDGSEVALARQLAADLGTRLQLVLLRPDERMRALTSGRVDVIASLPVQAAFLRHVAYARPHARMVAIIAGRPGRRLRGYADLAGFRVALPIGTTVAGVVHPNMPADAVAVFLQGYSACLAALRTGEVDAAVAFDWSVQDLLLTDRTAPIEPGFQVQDVPLALAVASGERDLLAFLDTFLLLRTEDGTIEALRRRYFVSAPPTEGERPGGGGG